MSGRMTRLAAGSIPGFPILKPDFADTAPGPTERVTSREHGVLRCRLADQAITLPAGEVAHECLTESAGTGRTEPEASSQHPPDEG
jgi:hypothetical protein